MDLAGKIMQPEPEHRRSSGGLGWSIAILLTSLLLASGVMGYLAAHNAHGGDGPSALIGFAMVMLVGIGIWALYLWRTGAFWTEWSPRKRLYWVSLGLSALLGMVIAAVMQLGQSDPTEFLLGSSPMPDGVAILLSLLWLAGLALALRLYLKTIDDHERRAHDLGCVAGFYAFVIPCPVWWALSRAELTSQVEAMPLFIFSVFVGAAVNLWFKFR